MKNFSEFSEEDKEEKQYEREDEVEELYNGYLSVKSIDDYEFVDEKDCVGILPHLIEYDEILLRKEYVPPFQYKKPNLEYFLTIVSGTIESEEKPEETLKRELEEETGIRLNSNYNNQIKWGEYFIAKGNSSIYYLYYLPLYKDDFQKIKAKGDGSKIEDVSSTVRVKNQYLKGLKPSDLVSALMIEYFKNID